MTRCTLCRPTHDRAIYMKQFVYNIYIYIYICTFICTYILKSKLNKLLKCFFLAHIRSIPEYKLHWDEFFGMAQSRLMPSFTPVGFKKVKAPAQLFRRVCTNIVPRLYNINDLFHLHISSFPLNIIFFLKFVITSTIYIYMKYQKVYEDGLLHITENGDRTEGFAHKPGSTTPQSLKPNFISTGSLNHEAMNELRPIMEAWSVF